MTDRTTTPGTTTSHETFTESERVRARQAAEEIKSAAKDAAASTATALRNRLSGELDYRKYRSRQCLNRVADALRQTGANVNETDDSVGRYIERAAQGVERMAAYIDEKEVDEILHDAREMARRRPEVFVGGLFIAGLMLGRFLRSSAPEQRYDETWDDLPGYAGGGSGGGHGSATNPYAGATNPYSATNSTPSTPPGSGTMP
jgi:hypothetical protein